MQRLAERHSDQVVRHRIAESHCPRQMAFHAPAAAGGEAAQAADTVAERNTRGEDIGGAPERQAALPHVPPGDGQRRDQSAIENTSGLERIESEDLAGILAVARIDDHHHQFGAHDGRQRT